MPKITQRINTNIINKTIFARLTFSALIKFVDSPIYLVSLRILKTRRSLKALKATKEWDPTKKKDKYFGIVERLNQVETQQTMMMADLEQNTEFRIKWPRGEMGSLPADNEQFMLIEHLAGELESLTAEIEEGRAPYDQQQKLTLEFYEKRINQLEEQIEKIKDAQLEIRQKNGH